MKFHILSIIFLLMMIGLQQRDLFAAGFFPMHDDTQVARVVTMGKALRNGQFPVRWVDDLGYGYGYPIYNFYGPLPYYVGGFVYAVGISGLIATKVMIFVGCILAALTMYWLLASVWDWKAGIVGAVFYSYAIYHSVQIFVRGAIGEYWATAFFPLIALGLIIVSQHKSKRGILIGAIGTAGMVLSHTLLGYAGMVLLVGFLIINALFSLVKKPLLPVRSTFILLFVGLALSAFFWIPALVEMKFTDVSGQIGSTARYIDHFVCISQLWSSPWGYGGSSPECTDGISFALGRLFIVTTVMGILLIPFVSKFTRGVLLAGSALIGISLFLTLAISAPVWRAIPFFAYLQYPWRFLSFTIFGMAIVSTGIVVAVRAPILKIGIAILLVTLSIVSNTRWFRVQYSYAKDASAFESEADIKWRASRISDEYLPKDLPRPQRSDDIVHDTIERRNTYTVKTVTNREVYKKFEIVTEKDEEMRVNIAAFPGWEYIVNGKPASHEIARGLPLLIVPKGFNTMELHYKGTMVQSLANAISAITIIGIIYFYGKKTIG